MRDGRGVVLTLGLALLAASPGAARAETPPPAANEDGPSYFLRAGKLIRDNAAAGTVERRDATLTARRAALNDPKVTQALALFRAGLNRSLAVRPDPDGEYLSIFAQSRSFARLLAGEITVAFADGRNRAAFASLEDGLRLGHALKGNSLPSMSTGQSIEATVLHAFAFHLDRLPARDCERLLLLMRRHLARPDPLEDALRGERGLSLSSIGDFRKAISASLPDAEWQEQYPDATPAAREEASAVAADPARREKLLAELSVFLSAHQDDLEARVRRAIGLPAPTPAPLPTLSPFGEELIGDLSIVGGTYPMRVAEGRTKAVAMARLMAVHAALRRWRWEYGRYPENLDALDLGALTVDPFADKDKPFRYAVDAETGVCTLESIGPHALDFETMELREDREPLTLPLKLRPPKPPADAAPPEKPPEPPTKP